MNENAIHQIESQRTASGYCHMSKLRCTKGSRVDVFRETTSQCDVEENEREWMIQRTKAAEVAYKSNQLAKHSVNRIPYQCSPSVALHTRVDRVTPSQGSLLCFT